ERAQSWHPGVHAAHGRNRPGVPAFLPFFGRDDVSGRQAGPGCRYRRKTRGELSLPASLLADQPEARRHDAQLVGAKGSLSRVECRVKFCCLTQEKSWSSRLEGSSGEAVYSWILRKRRLGPIPCHRQQKPTTLANLRPRAFAFDSDIFSG